MLMIFAVMLCCLSSSERRVRVPFRPEIFWPFFSLLLKQQNITAKIIDIEKCFLFLNGRQIEASPNRFLLVSGKKLFLLFKKKNKLKKQKDKEHFSRLIHPVLIL